MAVTTLMERVGLTQGGFYSHFASKDALVREAIDVMFDDALRFSRDVEARSKPEAVLLGYIDAYLSPAHRDAPGRGCPLPALAGDFARRDAPARDRFEAGLGLLTGRLAAAVADAGLERPEAQASAILSQMVGTIVLARSTTGAASDAILADARASLISRLGLKDTA